MTGNRSGIISILKRAFVWWEESRISVSWIRPESSRLKGFPSRLCRSPTVTAEEQCWLLTEVVIYYNEDKVVPRIG